MSDPSSKTESGNWETRTPPESLIAMRRVLADNTATSQAALDWSMRTYNLVLPIANRMSASQRESRIAVVAAVLAVVVSCIGLACEAVR